MSWKEGRRGAIAATSLDISQAEAPDARGGELLG